jgi:hypothetical protein
MRKVNENKMIRCVALNTVNIKSDDVTGSATGCVEYFLMASENSFQVCNLYNGVVVKTYYGDEKGRHLGPLVGHTKTITCIYFNGTKAYT